MMEYSNLPENLSDQDRAVLMSLGQVLTRQITGSTRGRLQSIASMHKNAAISADVHDVSIVMVNALAPVFLDGLATVWSLEHAHDLKYIPAAKRFKQEFRRCVDKYVGAFPENSLERYTVGRVMPNGIKLILKELDLMWRNMLAHVTQNCIDTTALGLIDAVRASVHPRLSECIVEVWKDSHHECTRGQFYDLLRNARSDWERLLPECGPACAYREAMYTQLKEMADDTVEADQLYEGLNNLIPQHETK